MVLDNKSLSIMLNNIWCVLMGMGKSLVVTVILWAIGFAFGGWFICHELGKYWNLCTNEREDIDAQISDVRNGRIVGNSSVVDIQDTEVCTKWDSTIFVLLLVTVSIGSAIYVCVFFVLCYRFAKEDYMKLKKKKRTIQLESVIVEEDENTSIERIHGSEYVSELSPENEVDIKAKDYVNKIVRETWKYDERIGRDARQLTHKELVVKEILKVNNQKQWGKYQKERSATLTHDYPDEILNKPVLTTKVNQTASTSDQTEQQSLLEVDITDDYNDDDELGTNEVYLFHGTKLQNIPGIVENGFNLGRARQGLYGKAIYLAESSEKADQYADYPKSRRKTDLAMLVIRVTLGRVHCHIGENVVHIPKRGLIVKKPMYDTVVAGVNKRFREFLIFDVKQCYPEYIVLYDRQ